MFCFCESRPKPSGAIWSQRESAKPRKAKKKVPGHSQVALLVVLRSEAAIAEPIQVRLSKRTRVPVTEFGGELRRTPVGHQNPGIHALKIPALQAMVKTHKSDYSPLQRHRHARIIEHNSRGMMAERNIERKEGDLRALSCLPPCMPLCVCVCVCVSLALYAPHPLAAFPPALPGPVLSAKAQPTLCCAMPALCCGWFGIAVCGCSASRYCTALHCALECLASLLLSPNRTEPSLVSLPTEVI